MKSFTSIEQSRQLAEILPIESADMHYSTWTILNGEFIVSLNQGSTIEDLQEDYGNQIIPCWSLTALLEYMNRNFYNISLNYCGAEYTISFDDGERYKTITKDYSIDAAFEMIVWLKEKGLI